MVHLRRHLSFLTKSQLKNLLSRTHLCADVTTILEKGVHNFSVSKRKYSVINEQYVVRSPYPDIEIPRKTFTELLWKQSEKWKSHTAVACGVTGESYTYAELLERASRIGRALLNEGLRPGDVIAFLLSNKPDFVAAILGASKIGLTICSINPLYTPHEIAFQIDNSGAKCLITFPDKTDDAIKALEIVRSKGKNSTKISIISTKGLDGKEAPNLPQNVTSLEKILHGSKIQLSRDETPRHIYSNLAFISHSSGTTGLPKGVCLTHQNVTASILQMAFPATTCFKETTSDYQDVMPMLCPIYHNYALEIMLDCLYHGAKMVTLSKFEEKTFLPTLKDHKATGLFVVPPIVIWMAAEPNVTKEHLEHVRVFFSAAAPLGSDDIERILLKSPPTANFIQGYGQTESMCCLSHCPYNERKYKTVGQPLVNTLMKVVDIDTGASKKPFEEGEICFQGPQMSLGYLNNPKATAESIDTDGWFHTGDVGYYDENGYFYIVDRIKELIKVKGFQVAPAELEALLRNHPAVEDVGVVGVPDQRKGEAPVAFIKLKFNTTVSESDLKNYLSEKVAPFKKIDKFHFVDSIPKNPSGKIMRKQLKLLVK